MTDHVCMVAQQLCSRRTLDERLGFLPVFLVAELSCFIRFSYRVADLRIVSINNDSLRREAVSHSSQEAASQFTLQKWRCELDCDY